LLAPPTTAMPVMGEALADATWIAPAAPVTALGRAPILPPTPPPAVPPPPPPPAPPPLPRAAPRAVSVSGSIPPPPPAPVAAPASGGNRALLLAAGAGFLAMTLGIAGLFLLRKPAAEAPPVSTPPLAAGLRVESTPAGASVRVNGEIKGTTPMTLPGLSHGLYEVEVELAGYETARENVALTQAAPARELMLSLTRAVVAPNTGLLEVVSQPPGAAVQVDGVAVGTTPLRGFRLPAGKYTLTLALVDHETVSRKVEVAIGETETLTLPLRSTRVHEATELDAEVVRVSGQRLRLPAQDVPRTVVAMLTIGADGRVDSVEITESAGRELDELVRATVREWRYEPGRRNGVPVKFRFLLRVRVPVK
ncbi:MAG: TonB family protein, partial [Vicinamibacteria bacterium]|nr:TonB family protein [Vicinamibacteria bacterium]